MQYAFMRPKLDSHNLHKQISRMNLSLYSMVRAGMFS